MSKVTIVDTIEQKCSYCGAVHNVLIYKESFSDYPVPDTWRKRGIRTFPTSILFCYCSRDDEYFTPSEMLNDNVKSMKNDYIKHAAKLGIKVDQNKLS